MTTQTRQQEINAIHKQYPRLNFLALGLVILLVGILVGFHLVDTKVLEGDYPIGLYSEFISIIITIVVLDQINDYRDTQRLKRRLIGEASSQSNETAKSAIDWMRREGWLTGENGLLKNINLKDANLAGANLSNANLSNTDLHGANLSNANLWRVNLEGANLTYAKLDKADLWDANLQDANLMDADLASAHLHGANLKRAILIDANLEESDLGSSNLEDADLCQANLKGVYLVGANLKNGHLNRASIENVVWEWSSGEAHKFSAIMPDGEKWSEDTVIERFTDGERFDFWITPLQAHQKWMLGGYGVRAESIRISDLNTKLRTAMQILDIPIPKFPDENFQSE